MYNYQGKTICYILDLRFFYFYLMLWFVSGCFLLLPVQYILAMWFVRLQFCMRRKWVFMLFLHQVTILSKEIKVKLVNSHLKNILSFFLFIYIRRFCRIQSAYWEKTIILLRHGLVLIFIWDKRTLISCRILYSCGMSYIWYLSEKNSFCKVMVC